MEFTAQQIAAYIKGIVEGDPEAKVRTFSKIEEGKEGTLSFLANPKYEHFIYETKASIVLVNNDFSPIKPISTTLIRVPNAYAALAQLLNMVENLKPKKNGIDSSAFIAASASLGSDCYVGNFAYIGEGVTVGKNCLIYPYVYVGDHVSIGDNCILYPHSTIYDGCKVGNNCILHAGSVIGADGFGFAPEDGIYKKIPQLGSVIIEDDVEIGANTAVDRAVMDATIVRKGVKLDNFVQVAHNAEIGENTVIAAQTGIAGSSKVGKNCMIGGQVGISGHLQIADNVKIGAQTGIIKNVKGQEPIMGSPSFPLKDYMRSSAIFRRLPEMDRTISKLQKEIEELKNKLKE